MQKEASLSEQKRKIRAQGGVSDAEDSCGSVDGAGPRVSKRPSKSGQSWKRSSNIRRNNGGKHMMRKEGRRML
eukprot:1560102-Ditylum_brightwellii.AAC.1